MDFYQKYRLKCAEKGLSTSGAAALAGISRTSVARWKKGVAKPTPANLNKICEVLDTPLSYFDDDNEKHLYELDLQLFSTPNPQLDSLVEIFNKLDEIGKAKLLVYAASLLQ